MAKLYTQRFQGSSGAVTLSENIEIKAWLGDFDVVSHWVLLISMSGMHWKRGRVDARKATSGGPNFGKTQPHVNKKSNDIQLACPKMERSHRGMHHMNFWAIPKSRIEQQ